MSAAARWKVRRGQRQTEPLRLPCLRRHADIIETRRRARTRRILAVEISILFAQRFRCFFLSNPPIPQDPAQDCTDAAASYHCDGRDAFLDDTNEAADEDCDGTDVLDNDHGVGH